MKADEVAVGVGDEELLYSGLFVADAVPFRLGLHEEVDTGMPEGGDQMRDARDIDLKVDSATEWDLEWASDPVPTDSDLFQHEVGRAERDTREALLGARVTDFETAHVAPKDEAALEVDDQEFGDQRRFKGFNH